MDVKQAVLQRRSIRAYLPGPCPRRLKDMLETPMVAISRKCAGMVPQGRFR